MTIQQTVLLGVAGLLFSAAPSASAQCSLVRIHHGFSHHDYHRSVHVVPRVTYRPRVHVTHFAPTAMAYQPLPANISFGAFAHVDELAHRLEVLMNQLCLDLYYNYSHNPGFAQTYAEAYSLYQMARDIHVAEHNRDRITMQQQLAGADALFYHVGDDVQGWSRIPRRQIGTLGILTKIAMAEETLQHLMEDVGVAANHGLEEPPLPESIAPQPQGLTVPPAPSFPSIN